MHCFALLNIMINYLYHILKNTFVLKNKNDRIEKRKNSYNQIIDLSEIEKDYVVLQSINRLI